MSVDPEDTYWQHECWIAKQRPKRCSDCGYVNGHNPNCPSNDDYMEDSDDDDESEGG